MRDLILESLDGHIREGEGEDGEVVGGVDTSHNALRRYADRHDG